MFEKVNNSKKQGNIGIGCAISYYCRLGYTVLLPLYLSQDYDLVIDKEGDLLKIQVKTTSVARPSGSFEVELRNKGGTSGTTYGSTATGTSDLLFILCADGSMYEVPKYVYSELKSSITLGTKYLQFKV